MHGTPASLAQVLARIASRLDGAGLPWALSGSASLRVRGAPVEPHDIDIRVAADDAERAFAALGGEVVQPVSDAAPGERAWSHRGRLRLDGWDVDLLGGLRLRTAGDAPWRPAPGDLTRAQRRRVGHEAHVPLLDLAEEAAVYGLLGRRERVAQVSALARRAA